MYIEYLAVFSQIIAYDDPEVFNHLDNIGFHPDVCINNYNIIILFYIIVICYSMVSDHVYS